MVEASVHPKTATLKLRELLHQSSISCATLAVLMRLRAVMHVKGHLRRCIRCCIPSKAMAKCKAILQLWQQRCSCGRHNKSCYGVGYVQFPPTVKLKESLTWCSLEEACIAEWLLLCLRHCCPLQESQIAWPATRPICTPTLCRCKSV